VWQNSTTSGSFGRLPLLSARPAVTPATLKRAATSFAALVNRSTMGVNSLPKTVTRQRRGCDLNPGRSVPESSTLTTRLLCKFRKFGLTSGRSVSQRASKVAVVGFVFVYRYKLARMSTSLSIGIMISDHRAPGA